MTDRPVVLATRRLPPAVAERLTRDYRARTNEPDEVFDADRLVAEAEGCDLLFIGTAHSAQRAQWLDRLANSPVLVVDEGAEFAWPNGMIRLHAEGARFRFEVNPTAIERAGLKLDPRLLRLADIATAP